ncbi:SDR family oxidoreductase [Methyloversatilis thermotolerans]|uniref:SDR family oxidoreductase n=1 Tax=Methyloversatilis thermotolerans TaxID=1346290 RepID=UPI000376DC14|nr:SDR family oxidoreductase [Methyloversatilis thermotolerans]
MNTSQKVAFITGGNRGIGLETARGLGKLGIDVVIGVRDPDKGEEAVAALRAEGIHASAIHFDAEKPASFASIRDHFERAYGRLDILVNNAGIALADFFAPNASTVSQDVLRRTFDINFFAVIELTQTLLPLIRKAPAGRIVNLSSILGSLGAHSAPDSPIGPAKELAYNASKTALNAFTVHLAAELKDTPIKVNSAHPGWVKTDMGGPNAPMDLADGGKTSVQLATLPADGPTGGYFHLGEALPW